jgi:hypothetical protein
METGFLETGEKAFGQLIYGNWFLEIGEKAFWGSIKYF